jgi:hypothetical protein
MPFRARSNRLNTTGHGFQVSDSSWWPRPSAWRGSGLNVGYWSPSCEAWFQERLSKIRANKAEVRTAAQWKDAMKMWKPCARFYSSNQKAAAMFLDGVRFD